MAPVPANTTGRVYIDYVTGSGANAKEHTVSIRHGVGISDVAVQNVFLDILEAFTDNKFSSGWRVIRCRVQAAGTDFSVPVAVTAPLLAFQGVSGGNTPEMEAREFRFVGRSLTTGRRVSFSLYGLTQLPTSSTLFRLTQLDDASIGLVVGILQAAQPDIFVTADGSAASWYNYANWQYNQYWERAIRA
jgi:hypothetical protein